MGLRLITACRAVLPAISCAGIALVLAALFAPGHAADNADRPERFLVLYEQDSALPANREIALGIEQGIAEAGGRKTEIYNEYLDLTRFSEPRQRESVAHAVTMKYAERQPDILLSVGPGALEFTLAHRDAFAPGKPVIALAISDHGRLPDDVGGVMSNYDVRPTIGLARGLQPTATSITVINGSSNFDKTWQDKARNVLGDSYQGLAVRYLSDRSLEDFETSVRSLKPDTIALLLTVFKDSTGRVLVPRFSAGRIAQASGAPVYAVYNTYIGGGIVGGWVYPFQSAGETAGKLASYVVAGKVTLPTFVDTPSKGVVDWRQLARYGLDEAKIPPDVDVQYFEPGPWRRYRTEILVALSVLILQTATIVALLVEGRRRRRATASEVQSRSELTHLSRAAQLGELSGALAHELNQPLTSIMANAAAGARILKSDRPDLKELGEIMDDITESDGRAAGIIRQLRSLIVKREAELTRIDLNAAVNATLSLLRSELVTRQSRMSTRLAEGQLFVEGNQAQLQQILLNLISNALDAMQQTAAPQRLVHVETRLLPDGTRELSVADRGPGIGDDLRDKLFKPFVSGKAQGLGLGLSICTTIARAHHGSLNLDPGWPLGARFVLRLPAPPDEGVA